jgi:hypothetical protein
MWAIMEQLSTRSLVENKRMQGLLLTVCLWVMLLIVEVCTIALAL